MIQNSVVSKVAVFRLGDWR